MSGRNVSAKVLPTALNKNYLSFAILHKVCIIFTHLFHSQPKVASHLWTIKFIGDYHGKWSVFPAYSTRVLYYARSSRSTSSLACLIKPKFQMWSSYPLNLVHILILLGFAKKIKILAVPEVRPNLTSSSAENTKDFQNF